MVPHTGISAWYCTYLCTHYPRINISEAKKAKRTWIVLQDWFSSSAQKDPTPCTCSSGDSNGAIGANGTEVNQTRPRALDCFEKMTPRNLLSTFAFLASRSVELVLATLLTRSAHETKVTLGTDVLVLVFISPCLPSPDCLVLPLSHKKDPTLIY